MADVDQLVAVLKEFEAGVIDNPDDSQVLTDDITLDDLDEAAYEHVVEIVELAETALVDRSGLYNRKAIGRLVDAGFDVSEGVIRTRHGLINYNEEK